MNRLLSTDTRNTALFVQRLILALVMIPHGAQKLLGWFGGFGFTNTMGYLTGVVHLPYSVALLVILAESLGAIALGLGLLSRVTALGITAVMLGAVVTTHLPHGFFMNWMGSARGEGFEYHLLALALSVPIVVWGGGRFALDTWLAERLRPARAMTPATAG